MKKDIGLAFAAFIFLSLNLITGAYAIEEEVINNDETVSITKYEMDVTGDGKKDTVELKGIPYEEGSSYLKEINLEVAASDKKNYKAELNSGFEPKLDFKDLNHDGVVDMYVSIPTGSSGGISNYFLYTLKDFQLKNLTVPDPLVITSEFKNGYKAKMTIDQTGESYSFNLLERKKEYDRIGLYHKGKLNEPRELMVDPYSTLIPIMQKDNMYGLKGIQQISGAYHADGISFVESNWFYEGGKWTLQSTRVMEKVSKKKKQ